MLLQRSHGAPVSRIKSGCQGISRLLEPAAAHPYNVAPVKLAPLLEDTTLLLVFEELLELTLFVAKALGARRHPRWRHVEQNVGTIHPVDMRHHRVKSTRGDILKAQVLIDGFMKQLNCPGDPISDKI